MRPKKLEMKSGRRLRKSTAQAKLIRKALQIVDSLIQTADANTVDQSKQILPSQKGNMAIVEGSAPFCRRLTVVGMFCKIYQTVNL